MKGGFNDDHTGYYVRTDHGLWIRSHWCHDTGMIKLGWQVRYRVSNLMVIHLDENGDPMESEPISRPNMTGPSWVEVGPFVSLDRVEVAGMGKGDKRGFIDGLMRHQALLLAMGIGENSREIAEWFEEPEHGKFMMLGLSYAISDGDGAFKGLDDMVLVIESLDEGRMVGAITVDGDDERYALEHDVTPEFIAQFVRSTTPID